MPGDAPMIPSGIDLCWKVDTLCLGNKCQNRKIMTKYLTVYLYKFIHIYICACVHTCKL